MFCGNRLDIGWIADRMPNGVSSPREFELTSVRVASAQMCVEDVGHRADIAPTIFKRCYHLPRHGKAARVLVAVTR